MKKLIVHFTILLSAGIAQVFAQPVLYGLTSQGGESIGTISKFETVNNNLSSVYNFPSGPRSPESNDLTQAANGKLYGMTQNGGSGGVGTIFSFEPGTNTLTKLIDFNFINGSNPSGSLVQASDGKLYGMTQSGGSNGYGTIFSFDPGTNSYTKLHDFNNINGPGPESNLVQASDGKLYGTTYQGGSSDYGTIFSFDPSTNTHTKLHDFNNINGRYPNSSLVQANDGKLYGMTLVGGSSDEGTIFSFDPIANTHTKLLDFHKAIGYEPQGSLMQASDGKIYGMTSKGGVGNLGTIFYYDLSANVHTKLFDFYFANGSLPFGGSPYGSLVQASDGKLYGLTSYGGSIGYGIIFSFDPNTNTPTDLQDFDGTNGDSPLGSLMQFSDSKLYGMTSRGGISGLGTIFSFDPVTNTHSKLHDFSNTNGSYPVGSQVQASDGKLYGVTQSGGSSNYGTIFSFDPVTNTQSKLHDFNNINGSSPSGSMVLASDGKLYGVTAGGGTSNYGTIFSFDPGSHAHTKLFDINVITDRNPSGSLVQASDGKLYGLTSGVGRSSQGTIFSFDPVTNTQTKLHDFDNTNGSKPNGNLVQASDSKLYGLTQQGGSRGAGTIFSFDPSTNTHANLHDFDGGNSANPYGSLMQASDGKLYGMTQGSGSGYGTIFSFDLVTKTHTKLYDFDGTIGVNPVGSLIQASDGKLYGMTRKGGSSDYGTIFSFEPGTNTHTKLQDFNYTNGSTPTFGALIEIISSITSDNSFFRSRQSGNWTDPTTWEFSTDSIVWVAANRHPVLNDTTIVIRDGHELSYNLFDPSNNRIDDIIVNSGGVLNVFKGYGMVFPNSIKTRPVIEINGTLNIDSGSIQNQSNRRVLLNGVCNMTEGFIITTLQPSTGGLYISQSGILNLSGSNSKALYFPVNYGTVNWNEGNIATNLSRPKNYGLWIDRSNGFINAKGLVFENYGTYIKQGNNSQLTPSNARILNDGIIKGYGIMDLGLGSTTLNLNRIAPGDSIGKLTLKFKDTMSMGELNIQLGDATGPGSGHDILTFYGNLTLSGTLNVEELNSLPEGNYTIVRKDSGSLSGTFATTNLPANYSLQYFTDSVVLVKIQSVPPKNISITNPTAITEGNSGSKELKFVLRLNQVSTGTVKVNYTTADSTATAGEDYTAISGTIAIPAGTLTDTIRVPILGDKLVEPFERIKVLLSNPVNGIITTGLAIGTINNDDALPALSITNYTLSEGTTRDSLLQVQVRLSASYPLPVTVNYATQDSTATDGIDYSGAIGTLTFQPGDTLEFIPVLIKADGIDEGNEILHINLSAVSNATLAATTRGRITINDDDNIPVITLGNVSITEGNTTDTLLQVKVRLSRSYILPVTINYSTFDSTATQGNDYTGGSGTLTFQPGDTLEYIPVLIKGDRIDEPNEIINIAYSNPDNGVLPTTVSRVTITDNDLLPAVTFTNLTITEGNNDLFNTATVTVRLNRSYPLPVSVNYTLLDSTAVNGSDYQSVQGTLNFAAEDTLENISFPVLGDRVVETSEIIKLIFSSPVNATATAVPYRITIGNDDSYPAVSVTAPIVTEGDAGLSKPGADGEVE